MPSYHFEAFRHPNRISSMAEAFLHVQSRSCIKFYCQRKLWQGKTSSETKTSTLSNCGQEKSVTGMIKQVYVTNILLFSWWRLEEEEEEEDLTVELHSPLPWEELYFQGSGFEEQKRGSGQNGSGFLYETDKTAPRLQTRRRHMLGS